VDQWNHGKGKERIRRRKIEPLRVPGNSTYLNLSDNALAFSVIE